MTRKHGVLGNTNFNFCCAKVVFGVSKAGGVAWQAFFNGWPALYLHVASE